MDKLTMGDRIKEIRRKCGLTQEHLAQKLDISVEYVSQIEQGEKTPSLDVLINIANSLEVSCDYLLRDSVDSGAVYVDADIARKLSNLTLKQRIGAEAILDAYIKSL